jgi:hypothetical protein
MFPFLLIIVLMTPTGELQNSTTPVQECPPHEEMKAKMTAMRDAGVIKDWLAWCVATKLPMDKDGNPIKGQDI